VKVLAVEVDYVLKMLKSKKGISPILATLLLIVIAVAAVIVTYAWVMTFTGSQTQQAGVFLTKENISWASGSITVVIRNTGTANGKVVAAYMGTSSTNLSSVTMSPTSGTVSAGSSASFTLTYTWASNTRHYFKFATDTPATLEFSEQSP
jgi:flagellin-like protein